MEPSLDQEDGNVFHFFGPGGRCGRFYKKCKCTDQSCKDLYWWTTLDRAGTPEIECSGQRDLKKNEKRLKVNRISDTQVYYSSNLDFKTQVVIPP